MTEDKFKQCPHCQTWLSARDFINNPEVKLISMVLMDSDSEVAHYLYHHDVSGCGTSFLVKIRELKPFLKQSLSEKSPVITLDCLDTCSRFNDLKECDHNCAYAPFRKLVKDVLAV
jgi:hypothetical protein